MHPFPLTYTTAGVAAIGIGVEPMKTYVRHAEIDRFFFKQWLVKGFHQHIACKIHSITCGDVVGVVVVNGVTVLGPRSNSFAEFAFVARRMFFKDNMQIQGGGTVCTVVVVATIGFIIFDDFAVPIIIIIIIIQ